MGKSVWIAACMLMLAGQVNAEEIVDETAISETEPENLPAEPQYQPLRDRDLFSPEFMKSWSLCKPDSTERNFQSATEKVVIQGIKNNRCAVEFLNFDMTIPKDILPNIHGFDDLKTLLKNGEISHYNYQPEYVYNGLLFELENCEKYKSLHVGSQTQEDNGFILVRKGLSSEYINGACFIKLQNEVEIDGGIRDYTVLCRVNEKNLRRIIESYQEVLDKYAARKVVENGKSSFRAQEQNAETDNADAEIMYYMQTAGYCQKPNY